MKNEKKRIQINKNVFKTRGGVGGDIYIYMSYRLGLGLENNQMGVKNVQINSNQIKSLIICDASRTPTPV